MTSDENDPKRELLRHTLATLAYRGAKAVKDAPATFAGFGVGDPPRTAAEILAHIGDLLDWALSQARGEPVWKDSTPVTWEREAARFFLALGAFDAYLAGSDPLHCRPENLFQGPIADALTHVGQLAMLRRMAGAPIVGENYFKADIRLGCLGPDQAPPRAPFA